MESPATKRMRLSASRSSLSGRKSLNGAAGSSLGRTPGVSVLQSANRIASTTQPTYDFIGGDDNETEIPRATSRPPSRSGTSIPVQVKRTALRTSMLPKPNDTSAGNAAVNQAHAEEVLALRSKVNSLDYELKNIQSERGLLTLQHEKELREAQARADAEYAKYQSAETERLKALRAAENAHKENNQQRDRAINEKASLERKIRDVEAKYESLLEDKEDVDGRFNELQRDHERFRVEEVEGKRARLETTLAELRKELEEYTNRNETTQKRLQERESDVTRLEGQVMELKGQAGGGEELDILKREFNEQINYVRRLEERAREQNNELRRLRDERRGVQVVEEEKRALETQVQVLKGVEKRAAEMEIQKEILEDERRTWTTLLESNAQQDDQAEFDSPEAVVKALVNERIERALAINRVGEAESELAGKDEMIRSLEAEKSKLQAHLDSAVKSTAIAAASEVPDNKAYKRLDRQRQLAVKEVEYLRAQLKTFDTEETVMMESANFDTQRAEQVKQLETLVDEYKAEIQSLHSDLSRLETTNNTTEPHLIEPRGTKRPATDETEAEDIKSQLGALLRKNKNLQTALQKSMSASQLMATEFQATKSQLKALRASSKTRVLELRDNPTSNFEAIKQTTLRTLKSENEHLMRALRGQLSSSSDDINGGGNVKMVPQSSLDALNLDLSASHASIADKEKSLRRQREIWTQKAAEFRDVIASVLGYRIVFLPNGKVKVSSIYYNTKQNKTNTGEGEDDEEEEEMENYILFDGEKGTMKVCGSPDFARDVGTQLEFWVKDRKEIPCFLAAATLEFYERFGSPGGEGGS